MEAILPERNYPKLERYNVGDKVQALLLEVRDTESGGAEVIFSRSHPEFVAQLFIQEVPELHDGTITIEKIVRDPGYRTKLAVRSFDPKVDPVGTCVGVRGTRVKNIIRELNNEKIDIVPYSDDTVQLLQNLLAPAEIRKMKVYDDRIWMVVTDEDYPTVIGKKGMNARLIGQMLGKEIDVHKLAEYQKLLTVQMAEIAETADPYLDEKIRIEGVSNLIVDGLVSAGYDTLRKFMQGEPTEIPLRFQALTTMILPIRSWNKSVKKRGNR